MLIINDVLIKSLLFKKLLKFKLKKLFARSNRNFKFYRMLHNFEISFCRKQRFIIIIICR